MRLILIIAVIFLICCFVPLQTWSQVLPHGLIVPGESVAGVKLGSSLTDFKDVFPKHTEGDQSWDDDVCGGGSSYQWVDVDLDATGVYAYLRNNKIYQLRVQTPRFSLSNDLKLKASEENVRHIFPNGRIYVLRYSDSKVVGSRDLHYWVDVQSGIAFELYWDRTHKRRLVSSIDIFPVGAEYQPEGCVAPPREWIEVRRNTKRSSH
jgi:hypothetical protein